MEQSSERARGERDDGLTRGIEHQLLLIPEAPVLLALLLIGWAYDFPPAVGALAAIAVFVFVLRLWLMTVAAQNLERARYRQADRFSRAALRIYPWSADALTLRAHGLFLQGDDAQAEPLLRRAARLAPDSEVIQGALAGTLVARGKYAAARQHATQARRASAESPFAAQHLAWLALHVDDDPMGAQRILSEIDLHSLPATYMVPLLLLVAEVQIVRGATLAATETSRQIEVLLPECPIPQQAEVLYQLGKLQGALGGWATPLFRRSIDLDPHGRYARAAWRAAMERDEPARPLAAS